MKGKHAQSPGTTSLYPANTEHGEVGGSEDQRAWFGGGKRGKDLFCGSCPSSFWEVRPARMTDHPKEARLRGEPLGACLKGKRERKHLRRGR